MARAQARRKRGPSRAQREADPSYEEHLSGPPFAAVLAAGIGTFVLGVMTTFAEVSADLKEWLAFRDPVGPLAGKTTLAVAAWAVSWLVLGIAWRRRNVNITPVLVVTAVLIGLGLLGTFPSFFEQFAPE